MKKTIFTLIILLFTLVSFSQVIVTGGPASCVAIRNLVYKPLYSPLIPYPAGFTIEFQNVTGNNNSGGNKALSFRVISNGEADPALSTYLNGTAVVTGPAAINPTGWNIVHPLNHTSVGEGCIDAKNMQQWHTLDVTFDFTTSQLASIAKLILDFTPRTGGCGGGACGTTLIIAGAPLPLSLINFTAENQGKVNSLKWITTNEINTQGFEIERSADGVSFQKIGTVPSVNQTTGANYSYEDSYLQTMVTFIGSKVFYRLKMLDKDGKFTYSNVIWVNFEGDEETIVYPNPARDFITLFTNKVSLKNSVARITDVNGKIVSMVNITAVQQRVDVSKLQAGFYFIRFADGSVQRLVKQQ